MPMTKDKEILRQVFLWMLSRYRHAVQTLNGRALKIHDLVSERYDGFQDVELEGLLSTADVFNCLDHKKFLILEPVSIGGWMLPVLSFGYDFRRSHPEFRLRLALFLLEEDEGKSELRAIGYRFESPEGEGIHHYYHAQIINAFEKGNDKWRIPSPRWLPTKQPAFALDACSPVTLIACMLISIYGRDFVAALQEARFWDQVKPHLSKLMSSDSSFQPSYWEVTFDKSKKYYKTWEKPAKFKQVMKNKEEAKTLKEISLREYSLQEEEHRVIF